MSVVIVITVDATIMDTGGIYMHTRTDIVAYFRVAIIRDIQ